MTIRRLPSRAKNTFKSLARINRIIHDQQKQLTQARAASENLFSDLKKSVDVYISSQEQRFENYETKIREVDRIEDKLASLLSQKLEPISLATSKETGERTTSSLLANNHSFDKFYIEFENKFRGNEELIYDRQKNDHLKRFKNIQGKVLDIGCGRGEFLKLMKDNEIKAVGIDLNENMVKRCQDQGFEAVFGDAVEYLEKSKPNSLGAITGFHIVEHIPFEDLMELFESCYRATARGGFVLFETPNPENLIVGSCQFYYDPSHLRPIPPAVLQFMLEFVGFKAEIVRLHPIKQDSSHEDPVVQELSHQVFGPMDYAVVAKKL
jgi:O-antigen chain-terminating methyltransferase